MTVEQLVREGEFQKPSDQTNSTPEVALQDIAIAAKTSLLLTPDDSIPTQNFSNIKQGRDESFIKFVDRLKVALEKQTESPEGQKELLSKLAMANANEQCKTILRALPLDMEPTIEQMVEGCTCYTSTKNAVAQAVAKGIAERVSGAFAAVASKDNAHCFNCREFGHFIKDCPENSPTQDHRTSYQRSQRQ